MREIKFRAWNLEVKTMGDPFTLQTAVRCSLSDWFKGINTDEVVYMQYTGLKDKNGNEMFHGDVYVFEDAFGRRRVSKVAELPEFYHWSIEHAYEFKSIEVIGNIYENPELLK